jgi:hypothetical protein
MPVAVQSFGSIWTARDASAELDGAKPARRRAYYNTTGVLAGRSRKGRTVCAMCFPPEVRSDGAGVAHAVDVNAVHLDLLRSHSFVSWEYEMEIRCRNELEGSQRAKEYDAIVTLSLGGRELRIALEYERTPKTKAEYDNIVATLATERKVERVLYLAGTRHIQSLLLDRFSQKRPRVFIALASDLQKAELGTWKLWMRKPCASALNRHPVSPLPVVCPCFGVSRPRPSVCIRGA